MLQNITDRVYQIKPGVSKKRVLQEKNPFKSGIIREYYFTLYENPVETPPNDTVALKSPAASVGAVTV